MIRYLITTNDNQPFLTEWFDPENNFNKDVGMVVYDMLLEVYTTDGDVWNDIMIDHL